MTTALPARRATHARPGHHPCGAAAAPGAPPAGGDPGASGRPGVQLEHATPAQRGIADQIALHDHHLVSHRVIQALPAPGAGRGPVPGAPAPSAGRILLSIPRPTEDDRW